MNLPRGIRILSPSRARNLALVAATVALTFLLWQSDQPSVPEKASQRSTATAPDGFVVDARYLSFDETGRLTTRLTSPRTEQYEAQQLALMDNPEATLFNRSSPEPWHLSANRGRFLQGENLLSLRGDVVITRNAVNGKEARLTTSRLTLDNDSRMVYTEAPVTLHDPYGVTRATGLTAWLDERVLELESQVEGEYELAKQATP